MSERWTWAVLMGAPAERVVERVREAELPVAAKVDRLRVGTGIFFFGGDESCSLFVAELEWPAWLHRINTIVPVYTLEFIAARAVIYEELVGPDGEVSVFFDGERRSCARERITAGVVAHVTEAMSDLVRRLPGLVMPTQRIWEGDPFTGMDWSAEEVATVPPVDAGRQTDEDEDEIPF